MPLNKRHLARLSKIAEADHESFYARRPEYRGRLIAVVLAQGAALHYLDRSNGVKDLDVWTFFALPVEDTRFPEISERSTWTSASQTSADNGTT